MRAPDWYADENQMPPETCPLLDEVIKSIEATDKTTRRARKYEEVADLKGALDTIETDLSGTIETLDMVRAMNSRLREICTRQAEQLAAIKEIIT